MGTVHVTVLSGSYRADSETEIEVRMPVTPQTKVVSATVAAGKKPAVCHMNEGHSAFLAVERIRQALALGVTDVGESRVQESLPKIAALGAPSPSEGEAKAQMRGLLQKQLDLHREVEARLASLKDWDYPTFPLYWKRQDSR